MNIASSVRTPWPVCGDFNDVLLASEKWGSKSACGSRMADFKICKDHCGLSHLAFSGPKFTWINKSS